LPSNLIGAEASAWSEAQTVGSITVSAPRTGLVLPDALM
jgi:hypothetical protein